MCEVTIKSLTLLLEYNFIRFTTFHLDALTSMEHAHLSHNTPHVIYTLGQIELKLYAQILHQCVGKNYVM
jgi:hypothetical protein